MAKRKNNKEGFTIIEVVLVLAIAGLIFLMVFVALPALQRSQRDTQRRQDVAALVSAVVRYGTNNTTSGFPKESSYKPLEDGTYDETCSKNAACRFIREYMNSSNVEEGSEAINTFKDPDGIPYSLVITSNFRASTDNTITYTAIDDARGRLSQNEEGGYIIEGEGAFNDRIMYLVPGAQCVDETIVKAENRKQYAVAYRLEGAGTYCQSGNL